MGDPLLGGDAQQASIWGIQRGMFTQFDVSTIHLIYFYLQKSNYSILEAGYVVDFIDKQDAAPGW